MITFIHTADIHYGMENYGKIDQKTGIHTRLLDFDRAFNACIDTACAQNVDFFLLCGDAYKTATPSPTHQRLLFKALLRLQQAHIPVVIIVGNHDHPLSFGKAHALEIFSELPLDGFHVIAQPKILSLHTKSGPVNIVGIPWPTRNTLSLNKQLGSLSGTDITTYIAEAVGTIIARLAQELDANVPAILAGHLTVSNGVFSGSEKRAIYGSDPVFLPSQLAVAPFDYVALGHLHRYQELNKGGFPPVVYCGSPERIDFGERKEEKGFCLVTIHGKGTTTYEFCTTPTRPFIQIEVSLSKNDHQTNKIIHALQQHALHNAVLKIVYFLDPDTSDEVDLYAVQKACSPAHYVVSITPVKRQVARERRQVLNIRMDTRTLLEHYFTTKPELAEIKGELIEQTLMFMQQAEYDEPHDNHQE